MPSHCASRRPPEPVMAMVMGVAGYCSAASPTTSSDSRANVGVVAAIARVQNFVVVVEHGHFYGGGAYVDANVERRLARGACGGLRCGGDCLLVVGFSHVGPLLHFDGFARLDETAGASR